MYELSTRTIIGVTAAMAFLATEIAFIGSVVVMALKYGFGISLG